jgi:hypothetical protein
MSFKYVNAVYELFIPIYEKSVLNVLAHHVNDKKDDGKAWPGKSRIAKYAGCSYDAVGDALMLLEVMHGVIEHTGWHPGKNGPTKEWTLNLDRILYLAEHPDEICRRPVKGRKKTGGSQRLEAPSTHRSEHPLPEAHTTTGSEPTLLGAGSGTTGGSERVESGIQSGIKSGMNTAIEDILPSEEKTKPEAKERKVSQSMKPVESSNHTNGSVVAVLTSDNECSVHGYRCGDGWDRSCPVCTELHKPADVQAWLKKKQAEESAFEEPDDERIIVQPLEEYEL